MVNVKLLEVRLQLLGINVSFSTNLRFNIYAIYLANMAIILFDATVTNLEVFDLIPILKAEPKCQGIDIKPYVNSLYGHRKYLILTNYYCEKEDILKYLNESATLFWRVGDDVDGVLAALTKLNDQESKFRM